MKHNKTKLKKKFQREMAIRNRETKKMKTLLGDEREEGRGKSKTAAHQLQWKPCGAFVNGLGQ